jgi:tRNA-dihydrouridine synthase B
MGCPAKRICNAMAGSALLKNEDLVKSILETVVSAVNVPVTLKIRTGWDTKNRNGTNIAIMAEQAGIKSLAVHGRTRACRYNGEAEYETIAQIKASVNIPVIANGDIISPEKAKQVLDVTKVDGLMIGRAARGNPWIFKQINYFLKTGEKLPKPSLIEIKNILLKHLDSLYDFYGEYTGVLMARKHLSWYSKQQYNSAEFRRLVNNVNNYKQQQQLTCKFFDRLIDMEKYKNENKNI